MGKLGTREHAVASRIDDVKKDNRCTAQDVLLVINYINSHAAGGAGEGEFAEAVPTWAEPQFTFTAWDAVESRATRLADAPPRNSVVLDNAGGEAVPMASRLLGVPLWRRLRDGPQADPAQTDHAFAELDDPFFDLLLPDLSE